MTWKRWWMRLCDPSCTDPAQDESAENQAEIMRGVRQILVELGAFHKIVWAQLDNMRMDLKRLQEQLQTVQMVLAQTNSGVITCPRCSYTSFHKTWLDNTLQCNLCGTFMRAAFECPQCGHSAHKTGEKCVRTDCSCMGTVPEIGIGPVEGRDWFSTAGHDKPMEFKAGNAEYVPGDEQIYIAVCPVCGCQSTKFPTKCPYDYTNMIHKETGKTGG